VNRRDQEKKTLLVAIGQSLVVVSSGDDVATLGAVNVVLGGLQ
jgi:hypothetical protein